jgi:fibronectin type 3 domain-containing protein
MPTGLSGKIDTNGVVTLKWKLGPEPDIIGYRVFTSNKAEDTFVNITPFPVKDTIYIDTISLNTLTKHVYYKVIAVDGHYNHSIPSQILELKRPDKVIPVMPLFRDVYVTDSSVVLSWFNSSSEDAVKTYLYRRTDKTNWAMIDSFAIVGKQQNYTDKGLIKKIVYYYMLEAKDEDGLLSGKCSAVSGRVFDTGVRKPLKSFKASYNKELKKVELNWEYNQNIGLYFVIYRSYNDGDFTVYKSVDGDKRSYIDGELVGHGKYQYAVRAMYNDGGQSPLSERISLMVEK